MVDKIETIFIKVLNYAPGVVLHTGRPSYTGGIGRRIMARGWENTQDPI
jgi:hypothetical protein